ncbi:MAG: [Fe-Fe] hydrogenase large subunit C-terminal domain-containing protein [Bacillota bacterium]|nr:[Fe-Fe] hydrogenase large subunit C-terminal domain-containing protein [Bacillota bacterium]
METYFHSVMLDRDKCMGCTTCIKHCPTEAIRVRNGKARIIKERCIDCGQCIRVCPHRAKKAVCDSFDKLSGYKYKVALPAPSFYGQFAGLNDIGIILTGLKKIGFDDVFEVARAAEIISDMTRSFMKKKDKLKYPAISSACPACVRLIKKRFPQLIGNVIPHAAPVDLAAMMAREQAVSKTGLEPSEIGVFFITPCPAKMTETISPVGLAKAPMDGAISMSEVYIRLLNIIKDIKEPEVQATSGLIGIGWSISGGEGSALLNEKFLAVDGIENVIKVLEDIEDDKLSEVEFIELNACTQGCVGGCLTVENPYVAKTRIRRLMKYLPVSRNKVGSDGIPEGLSWERDLEYTPIWKLDNNMQAALTKMQEINQFLKELPGLDCGSCGAPSCRAFAEDVVLGFAKADDCIFKMRERVQYMSGTGDADEYLPPPFRKNKEEDD